MNYLITGGAGFIGTNLAIKLSEKQNNRIYLIDNFCTSSANKKYLPENSTLINGDIKENKDLIELIPDMHIIFHLAAKGNVVESVDDPLGNYECNVTSTVSLLDSIRRSGSRPRVVFASTGGALMGNTPPPVNENSLPNPISPYGSSKASCEAYIRSFAHCYDIPAVICRFGNVYGRYSLHKKGVINSYLRHYLRGAQLTVFGDGNSTRDYIHVDDIVQGLTLCSEYEGLSSRSAEVFHLANGKEVSINELIEKISMLGNEQPNIKYMPARPGEVVKNSSDFSKANRTLGFHPNVSLDDGLKDLLTWLRDND